MKWDVSVKGRKEERKERKEGRKERKGKERKGKEGRKKMYSTCRTVVNGLNPGVSVVCLA